jgi:CubicO group peptidase (beta-lactamase class C family)
MTKLSVTRRHFVCMGAGAIGASLLPFKAAAAAPAWTWYWDTTPAAHETLRAQWSGQGYRPLSVSMMGASSAPRVNMVWVQRTGVAWDLGVDMPLADVESVAELWAFFGYRVTQLSATGSLGDPRFAMLVEQSGDATQQYVLPALRHAINANDALSDVTLEYWKDWALKNDWMPTALTIYGGAGDPRYAMVLHPNPNSIRWNIDGVNETASSLSGRHQVYFGLKIRPALLQVSTDKRYVTLYRDDVLGGGVEMRHDMTESAFNSNNQNLVPLGYYPTQLSVVGSGASRRYALVYAQAENVLTRSTTKRGDPTTATAVDDAMLAIMRNNGVRQASLAVTKGSKLVYARGFTIAESGSRITTNTMRFRVASVSKTLTAILIMRAMQEGLGQSGAVSLVDRKLQDILQLTKLDPAATAPNPDPAILNFTVRQALMAQTRIVRDANPWTVRDELVRLNIVAPSPPPTVTALQTARYTFTQPLMATAGYSNTAFLWLGLVLEKLYSKPYMQVLREKLLTPLGITRLDEYPPGYSSQPLTEALYEARLLEVVPNVINFSGTPAPSPYAGGGPPIWTAGACLTGAMADFAKVASIFSKPGLILSQANIDMMLTQRFGFDGGDNTPGGPINGFKGGGFAGTSASFSIAKNALSFAVAFNRDVSDTSLSPAGQPSFPTLRAAIANTAWGASDLFQQLGLPAG